MNLQPPHQTNELLYVGFNQDYGCFACGTDTGFRIFNCDPFKETFQRDFNKGGIGHVEMLFRCNILALVGGGRNPRYPPNKVMIWDDHQNRCIGELSFRSEVKSVKLRRDRVVVVLESKVYVYNFADLKLVDHIETVANPKGLCELCPYSANTVLVCPGLQKGHVRVELYDLKKTQLIPAHETSLACLALNPEGTRLATASETGTIIRIFDTQTGNALQALRRGIEKADIYSLAFNNSATMLACSSDKGTIHIFHVRKDPSSSTATADGEGKQQQQQHESTTTTTTTAANPRSSLIAFSKFLPAYFSDEWSFAHYRVPDIRSIVCFGTDPNSVLVVCADGSFFKAAFDPAKSGQQECSQEFSDRFVKAPETEQPKH